MSFPKGTRVLVVDDMLTMRKIVKKALFELGIDNIVEASDGQIAWNEIEKAKTTGPMFTFIVSDWNMPNMTGVELLGKVRGTESMKTLPFVLLTAETEKSQIIAAASLGVTAYITKPFSPQVLKEKLNLLGTKLLKAS